MAFRIYNTLTKSLEEFHPLHAAGEVTFYSCGPTVYDDAHIGNFRSFLNADMLRRALELHGMRVKHVMNITDVGHMTEDDAADGGGEDKMALAGRRIAEAKKSGKLPAGSEIDPANPYAVAEFYAQRFLEDGRHLGLKVAIEEQKHPELMPRPTRCVPQMIALVEQLVARGHAYVAKDGVVYFSVQSFPAYGKLSGNTLDNLREGEGGRISAENQASSGIPRTSCCGSPIRRISCAGRARGARAIRAGTSSAARWPRCSSARRSISTRAARTTSFRTTSARSRRAAARAGGRTLRAFGSTRGTCRSRARRCRSRRATSLPRAICLRRA